MPHYRQVLHTVGKSSSSSALIRLKASISHTHTHKPAKPPQSDTGND